MLARFFRVGAIFAKSMVMMNLSLPMKAFPTLVAFALLLSAAPLVATLSAQGTPSFVGSERAEPLERDYPEDARVIRMMPGEIFEVHQSARGKGETSFFVVREGRGVVQVVKEKKMGKRTYFLKALSPGETLGGVVDRKLLDRGEGFDPKNDADYSRIQRQIKDAPVIIIVGDPEEEKLKRRRAMREGNQ